MQRTVNLPTGPKPGWELDDTHQDGTELRSVPESLVILQSLRQSRSKWVTSMFPKFSTKARGSKASEVTPPPHTIKAHGKYDLHIGPHTFCSTAVYEVQYLPNIKPGSPEGHTMQGTLPLHATTPGQSQSSTSSNSFSSSSYVTPALSSKVAIASQTNPILANLLNAVINRTATDDQIKTLGLLIQSLEGVQQLESRDLPPSPVHTVSTIPSRAGSPKPFDIVLEFHERPSDRWIFPRGDVVCERVGVTEGTFCRSADVILTTTLLPAGANSSGSSTSSESPQEVLTPEVVSFRLSRVPQQLWELLLIWAGGLVKIEESRGKLVELVKQAAPQTYLAHRLPEGELLSEVQNAVAPSYTMKSIKPAGADSNRAKRKSVSRKATLISNTPSSPGEKALPTKRRQSLKAKAKVPPLIACHACGQTDVPLMMGGRYCRTCIDAGKAVAEVPQLPTGRGTQNVPTSTPQTPVVSDSQPVIQPSSPQFHAPTTPQMIASNSVSSTPAPHPAPTSPTSWPG